MTTNSDRSVLQERAEALARPRPPMVEEEARGGYLSPDESGLVVVVEFTVAGERYGLELALVREVGPLRDLTPVPGAPSHFAGVTAFRGIVLPVLDLRRYLGLSSPGITQLDRLLIISSNGVDVGILADALLGTRAVASEELQGADTLAGASHARFLKGIIPETCTGILDAAQLVESLLLREAFPN